MRSCGSNSMKSTMRRPSFVTVLYHAVAHDDGKWHGFSFCDQVIEDKLELTGGRPACLVLAVPVLEIENGERLVRLFFVGCRCVDDAAFPLSGHGRIKVFPADASVGYVFYTDKMSSPETSSLLLLAARFHVAVHLSVFRMLFFCLCLSLSPVCSGYRQLHIVIRDGCSRS